MVVGNIGEGSKERRRESDNDGAEENGTEKTPPYESDAGRDGFCLLLLLAALGGFQYSPRLWPTSLFRKRSRVPFWNYYSLHLYKVYPK